jgi:hypothetical protein
VAGIQALSLGEYSTVASLKSTDPLSGAGSIGYNGPWRAQRLPLSMANDQSMRCGVFCDTPNPARLRGVDWTREPSCLVSRIETPLNGAYNMPLHFPGVDETTFKTLAKRYRKILAAKKDNQPVPSLMQIQEDLVRAMGHKDMHAAQAFWENAEEEPMMDERGAMKHFRNESTQRMAMYEAPWKAAIAAMSKSPEAFSAWVKSNAATLVELRGPNIRTHFDLLAYAAMEGHEKCATLLEALGDHLTLERISQSMQWEKSRSSFDVYKNKHKAKPSQAALEKLFARLSPEECQQAFVRMGDYREFYKGVSSSMMADLFVRADKTTPPNNPAYHMFLLEQSVVKEMALGNEGVKKAWEEFLKSSRLWQVWTVMGTNLSGSNYLGHLLYSGNVAEVKAAEALIDPLACMEEAKSMPADLWQRGDQTQDKFFDHRLQLAALSGNMELVEYVLSNSKHTKQGLDAATGSACVSDNKEVPAHLIALGGQVKGNTASLVKKTLSLILTHSVGEVVDRLVRIFEGAGINASAKWDYDGNIAHMMVHSDLMNKEPDKCRELLRVLITDHGLDINQSARDIGTPLQCSVSYGFEDVSLDSISILLSLGADPNIYPKSSPSPIGRVMSLSGHKADAIVKTMASHANIWETAEGSRPMSNASNLKRVQKLAELGSDVKPVDVKSWMQRAYSPQTNRDADYANALLPMVMWAMDRGVKVDEVIPGGQTLFHLAVRSHLGLRLAAAMIERGVNVEALNENGKTALETADSSIRADLATLLAVHQITESSRRSNKP